MSENMWNNYLFVFLFLISDLFKFVFCGLEIIASCMEQVFDIILEFILIILPYYLSCNAHYSLNRLVCILFGLKQFVIKFHEAIVRYSIYKVEEYEY
jgi:hypothetical protein